MTDDFVSFVVDVAVVLDGVIAYQVDVLEEVLSAAVLAFVQLAQHHVKVHRSLDHLKVVVNLKAKTGNHKVELLKIIDQRRADEQTVPPMLETSKV